MSPSPCLNRTVKQQSGDHSGHYAMAEIPSGSPTVRLLSIRDRASPIDPFRPLEPSVNLVSIGLDLSQDELIKIGRLLADRPDVQLRITSPRSENLNFLYYFSGTRRVSIGIFELDSLDGLSAIAESVEVFTLDRTRKAFTFDVLRQFHRLDHLYVDGHKKLIDVIGDLGQLTKLALQGFNLPDLSSLVPLSNLRLLSLLQGGSRDLRVLPQLKTLEQVCLFRIAGLTDVSMIAELTRLKTLDLDGLGGVISIPNLRSLGRLEKLTLEGMKGITSLSPVAASPSLEILEVLNMPQLVAADYAPLIGHPSLRLLRAYPGSKRRHDEIKAMFPAIAE